MVDELKKGRRHSVAPATVWYPAALIPAFGRQQQVELCFLSEFQYSIGDIVGACLRGSERVRGLRDAVLSLGRKNPAGRRGPSSGKRLAL